MPSDDAAAAAVQNFLRSIQSDHAIGQQQAPTQRSSFTTLPDLLPPSTTIPIMDSADEAFANHLLEYLPLDLVHLNQEADNPGSAESTPETWKAAIKTSSLDTKKEILRKVLRSPQFSQSLSSLTVALRDGGLPSIGDALGVSLENRGFVSGGGIPIGGGNAVKAFLDGVKAAIEREEAEKSEMDTS